MSPPGTVDDDPTTGRHRWPFRGEHRRGRTAFVLAGGGSRGAGQVGMLAELTDRGIRPDRVYGASVGAVNAAAYCGDPTPNGVARMEDIWRSVTGEHVFPTGRVHGPWKFFQQRPAVHPNSGLRRIVEEGLLFERLEESPIPLEVVATSLVDGRERWFSEGPAADAILASAAIPSILPPVTLGDDVLVDGGVVDNVPISRPIAQGLTRIYVLLCGPLHFRPPMPRRPVENLVTAFFIGIHARFAREVGDLPPGVEVVVFSGGPPPADYRDFSETPKMIEEGRAEVAAVLDGQRASAHQPGADEPGWGDVGAPGARAYGETPH